MKKFIKKLCIIFMTIIIALSIFLLSANYFYPLSLEHLQDKNSIIVRDANGQTLRHFADSQGVYRIFIDHTQVSPAYLNTLLSYEDRYFYQHIGVNPLALLRASLQALTHKRIISGGSTLTMQVARLIDPNPLKNKRRTFSTKLKQILRAMQLEWYLSKSQILNLYLNFAPMGGNIEGVEAASWRYFSKQASKLNDAESALLVALPQRPSVIRPDRYPDKARKARDKVLKRLYDQQQLSEDEYTQLISNPLHLRPAFTPMYAPLLSERLKASQKNKNVNNKHIIDTPLDLSLQIQTEDLLKHAAQNLPPRVSIAVVIINNQTHELKVWAGSADFLNNSRFGKLDMVRGIRSPGSTLKPFIYGLALDRGIIHEGSLLTDVKRQFNHYAPKNFDRSFNNEVSVKVALQRSLNVPVVQVLYHLKPEFLVEKLASLPIVWKNLKPNLALALGGVGIDLLSLSALYSSLATEGVVYPLNYGQEIAAKLDADNKLISPSERLLSPEASYLIFQILAEIKPAQRFKQRRIAWKTGTSYGYRDAWSIGVSPDWTVGVWIGRPDGVPNIGALGVKVASPLMFDLFSLLPIDKHQIKKPQGIEFAQICWPGGRLVEYTKTADCQRSFKIRTINNLVPATLYDSHQERNHGLWPHALNMDKNIENNPDYNSLNKNLDANLENLNQNIIIIGLNNKSIIFKNAQRLPLQATGQAPHQWYLNGTLLTEAMLNLVDIPAGKARLSVRDANAKTQTVELEFRDFKSTNK